MDGCLRLLCGCIDQKKSQFSLVEVDKNAIQWIFCSVFLEYIYRYKVNEGVGIPKIPVHPIGYHDAEVLL